jgi:signal transduction histidine kinase
VIKKNLESSEYKVWRDRFLRKRLAWFFWLSFPCLLTYTVYDLYDADFVWQSSWVEADIVRLIFLLVGLMLYQTRWGYLHSSWLFLYVSWSITFFPQALSILKGDPVPSPTSLNMIFFVQTTFMPVYWRLHLLSQLGGLVSYWIGIHLRGSGLPDILPYEGLSYLYWFWISLICTMSVYLYEQMQQQEFESRRELNIFLHSVSHDLRAPVMGTSMVLQNLLRKKTSTNEILVNRSILQRLLQGSDRQLKMIDSLLETQRTSSQGLILNCQPCNLDILIKSIITEQKLLLEQNGVVVNNKIDRDKIPLINADSLQLWRLLNNLITNAFKHNPYGIELTIDADITKNLIKIYIIDNGIGIAPEQQTRLFELYSRGDRAHYMPGLGMGLYLCQQIVIAHGGEIGFDSHPGIGSTFWFTLPINSRIN